MPTKTEHCWNSGWKAWSSTGGVSRAGVFRYAQDDPSTSTPNLNLSRKARAPFQFANNFRDRYGRLRLPFASSCHSTALLARDGHALDAQCGAGERAAPDEVAADLSEVAEHLRQIAGDGDFFHGVGQL